MRRLEAAVFFVLAVVGGSVGSAWYFRQAPVQTDRPAVAAIVAEELAKLPKPAPGVDTTQVKSIVTDMLAAEDARNKQNSVMTVASLDPKLLDPMIDSYLANNPKILQRMNDALDKQNQADADVKNKRLIAANADAIFNDPDKIVIGNPKGDVTLVEMFDYNCSFCRGALPDLATLISEDKNLRVVLKEFPILSAGSVDAARVAVQVAKTNADYWTFHQALFTSRGEVTGDTALDEAKTLGLNPDTLKAGMQAQSVSADLQKSFDLANALSVSGTPTYIIGDKIIPGAVPIDDLRTAIANMRACGSAISCPAKAG